MFAATTMRTLAGAVLAGAVTALLAAPAQAADHRSATGTAPVGGVASGTSDPQPVLSGSRVKAPNNPMIYLVDPEGYRRWIPDPATYDNLFRDWTGVVVDLWTHRIEERAPLSDGAFLAKKDGAPHVYLVSNGEKRWIVSPAVFDKYWFDWGKIRTIPGPALDAIPTGPSWY